MAEEKKRPSVAEMLAAARKADGGKKDAEPAAEEAPAKPAAKAAKPAAKAAAPAGGKMSVADMLAAARSGGKPAAEAAATPAAKETPKPAAKPAAKAAKPAGPVVGTGKDTASILAAVRGSAKPGPTSKAEAAPDSKEAKEAAAIAKAKLAAMPVMPAKPEYAKPKPTKAPVVEERRNFLVDAFSLATGSMFALGNVALALTGGLSTLGLARYMFPNVLTEPPSRFKVGFKDNFSPGTVETKFVAQYGVWVVNTAYQGVQEIYALKTVCTHLGCTPNWLEAEQKFKCPCHGSGFYKDGINFEGPAPRPLERYAIRIADDGQVEIDKSKIFQEEMGQWNDPSSFIPV